jgi:hypothetical protein
MWGGPPFFIPDNCTVDVRNLAAAREWYKEKLGLREAHDRTEDDSGRPFADLCIPRVTVPLFRLWSWNRAQLRGNDMPSSTRRNSKRRTSGWHNEV